MKMHNNAESDITANPPAVTAEQVASYLEAHPDFFATHDALLAELTLPHASGAAVSLIERQVAILREQNRQYKHKLMELVQIGRENDALHQKLHRTMLALLGSRSLSDACAVLFEKLYGEFNAEVVVLRLHGLPANTETEHVQRLTLDDPALRVFESVLQRGQCQCGRPKSEQAEYLFHDRVAEVESSALIPLGEPPCIGLLAIGNADPDYYHPGMETQFLRNLGELVFHALKPCLELETDPA